MWCFERAGCGLRARVHAARESPPFGGGLGGWCAMQDGFSSGFFASARRVVDSPARVPVLGDGSTDSVSRLQTVMKWTSALVVPALTVPTLAIAAPASADCTSAGGTTICSQGEVRGSDTGAGPSGSTGPYVPYPCDWGYYACDELWNTGLYINLSPGRPDRPDGPGRPGGGRPGGGLGGGRQ